MAVRPTFSMSLPTPDHRQREPAMEIARVTPACAPDGMAAARSEPLPLTSADTTEMPKRRAQIQLIIIAFPSRYKHMSVDCGKYRLRNVFLNVLKTIDTERKSRYNVKSCRVLINISGFLVERKVGECS